MSDLNKDQLIQAAIQWIRANSRKAAARGDISAHTQLMQDGVLDSLGLVDLVSFLEKTSGKPIDLLDLDEKDFSTLDGLCGAALR